MKRLKQQDFELIVEVLVKIEGHPDVKRTIPLDAVTLRIPLS